MNSYDIDPAEQQAESLRRLFRYLADYVGKYHPFLRRIYRDQGVDVRRLRTLADLRSLPLLGKDQLRAHPALFVLQPRVPGGPALPDGYDTEPLHRSVIAKYALHAVLNYPRDYSLAVRHPTLREKIRRRGQYEWFPIHYHASTGSTGEPTPVGFTLHDIRRIVGRDGLPDHPGETPESELSAVRLE
jgi:hypothetical protein